MCVNTECDSDDDANNLYHSNKAKPLYLMKKYKPLAVVKQRKTLKIITGKILKRYKPQKSQYKEKFNIRESDFSSGKLCFPNTHTSSHLTSS